MKVLFDSAWAKTIMLFERHGGTLESDDDGRSWCISSEPSMIRPASLVASAPCEFEVDGDPFCDGPAESAMAAASTGLMFSESGRAILTWCGDPEGHLSATLSVNAKEEHFERDLSEARQWLVDVRVPAEELARLAKKSR